MSDTQHEPEAWQASDRKWDALEAEPVETDVPSVWWARPSRVRQWLVWVGAAFVALMLIGGLAGLGPSTDKPGPSSITNTGPGNPEVYRRIDALTDCTELQREFDTAAANNDRYDAGTFGHETTLAYMEAANRRMEEVGCYKG